MFGGIGTTFLWKHLLKYFGEIDYAVLGEGEYSFLHLIQCIENENYEEIKEIKGIAFRNGKEVMKTGDPEVIQDLDQLPMPSKYFEFQHLTSSRGCPANCTFCGSPQFWGRKVRFHSPEYFLEQLERLYHKGITFFYVSDDVFTMRKDLVIQVCKKIIKKGLNITWFAISRVNYVDEEMLYWMRKAGCIQISYGVESGSEKIRKALNKN
ncbi:MAG: radical SAM protein, partial [Thermodesulfovibrionales bacterium]|nr:radical SAM protein [Thermodesulfovibrionales bacterium]